MDNYSEVNMKTENVISILSEIIQTYLVKEELKIENKTDGR